MRLIKINYYVMPDLIRHPEYIAPPFLDSDFYPPGGLAGMTSRSATMENLLRLKAMGFNHPRKRH